MADDQQADIVRTAQLMAQGYLIDLLLAAHFAQTGKPAAAAEQLLQLVEATVQPVRLPGVPSSLNDLAAQAYRDTVVHHIQRARSLATGEPFDPEAFPPGAPLREH